MVKAAPNAQQQEKAIDSLKDWGKWLVGLNFSSATGCVVVLQQGVSAALKPFLAIAILFFALSTLVSAVIFAVLPGLIEHLPLRDSKGNQLSIYEYRIIPSIRLKILAWLQFILFLLALISLYAWVALKPAVVK